MDLDARAINALIALLISLLIALNLFLKSRYQGRKPVEMVLSLLADIEHNLQLVEEFQFHLKVKKFKTESWQRNKTRLNFLSQPLLTTLDTAFSLAIRFNRDIDIAKKRGIASYLTVINIDQLKEPLAKSRQGLEEWLRQNAKKSLLARHHS